MLTLIFFFSFEYERSIQTDFSKDLASQAQVKKKILYITNIEKINYNENIYK
jgi:hypothetical protein